MKNLTRKQRIRVLTIENDRLKREIQCAKCENEKTRTEALNKYISNSGLLESTTQQMVDKLTRMLGDELAKHFIKGFSGIDERKVDILVNQVSMFLTKEEVNSFISEIQSKIKSKNFNVNFMSYSDDHSPYERLRISIPAINIERVIML